MSLVSLAKEVDLPAGVACSFLFEQWNSADRSKAVGFSIRPAYSAMGRRASARVVAKAPRVQILVSRAVCENIMAADGAVFEIC